MKLRVVGVSGAGKTRLARSVGAALRLPVLELDAVFWDAGWVQRDVDQALARVRDFVAAHPEGWVIEGNWSSKLAGLLDPGTPGGADAWVWLDYPRPVVMRRIVARTLRRGLTREELWHGNRERPSGWLRWDPERNVVRWAWVQHPVLRERMLRRAAAGEPVVRLRNPRAAEEWLAGLGR
ncbi:toxin [Microbacterium sp. RD1]|uniref:toxin n=1 Tax=Microbacterium sp. RD1 TaxID=3457313 RepID=UPI003FA5FA73